MIFEFDSQEAYHHATAKNPGLIGTPPVNAAKKLGISRQGVHEAIKRQALDAVKVEEDCGRAVLYVTRESMERYSQTPARGRPPKAIPKEGMARWKNYKAYSPKERTVCDAPREAMGLNVSSESATAVA